MTKKRDYESVMYNVEDIRCFFGEVKKIEANSPLEAARKAFPGYKVIRAYDGVGDIVVGRYTRQYYGLGYRTYVYKIEGRV